MAGYKFDPLNPDGNDDDPETRAAIFCKAMVPLIRGSHRKALADQIERPIILLFDISDRQARRIALELPIRQAVEMLLSERDGGSDPRLPGAAIAVSFEWIKTSLADHLGDMPEFVVSAPNRPEEICVLVFTGGIACWFETCWMVNATDDADAVARFNEMEFEFSESLSSRERWCSHPPAIDAADDEGDEWKGA